MSASRTVSIPPDRIDAAAVAFPSTGSADKLDYTFDFTDWLAPLDRVGAATAGIFGDGISCGASTLAGNRVALQIGPCAPGVYTLACAVLTAQGRRKTVAATLAITAPGA